MIMCLATLKKNFISSIRSIFIDWQLVIWIIGIYLILGYSSYSPLYFPSVFSKLDFKGSSDILGNIIKGITGVLGITISVLIISIQIYRNKYEDYAVKIIMNNRKLKRIVSVFVTNLSLSFISLIIIEQNSFSSSDINRVYFMLILFIFTILFLFSSIGSIIYSTSNLQILSNLKKETSNNSYLSLVNASRSGNSFDYLREKDSNPIIELQKLTFLAIKNNDEIFFEQLCEFRKILIVDISTSTLKSKIPSLQSWSIIELYNHYLVQPTFENLIKTKNERLLKVLINEICGVISFHHEKKIFLEVNSLMHFLYQEKLRELFIEPYHSSINQLFSNSIYDLYRIFQKYNEPVSFDVLKQTGWTIEGKEMDIENSEEDRGKVESNYMIQNEFHLYTYIAQVESIIDLAIDLNAKIVFDKNVGRFFNRGVLENMVFDLDVGSPRMNHFSDFDLMEIKFNLNEERRLYFIGRFVEKLINLYIKAVNKNMINQSEIEHIVDSSIYVNFMKVEKAYALIPIKKYLAGLNILIKTKTLLKCNFEYTSSGWSPLKNSLEFAFANFNNFSKDIIEIILQINQLKATVYSRNNAEERTLLIEQLQLINNLNSQYLLSDPELVIVLKRMNA